MLKIDLRKSCKSIWTQKFTLVWPLTLSYYHQIQNFTRKWDALFFFVIFFSFSLTCISHIMPFLCLLHKSSIWTKKRVWVSRMSLPCHSIALSVQNKTKPVHQGREKLIIYQLQCLLPCKEIFYLLYLLTAVNILTNCTKQSIAVSFKICNLFQYSSR